MIAETKRHRNRYDEEFKRNAVRILLDSGKPVTTVASQLGIEQSNLHKWNKRYGSELKVSSVTMEPDESRDREIVAIKNELMEIKATVETLRTIILKSLGEKYL